jgi:hypothetical protein
VPAQDNLVESRLGCESRALHVCYIQQPTLSKKQ